MNVKYKLINYCEIDKYASKSYSVIHDVSEDMNLGDITKIDISKLSRDVDIITHGSPCTNYSVAGKGDGGG
ncbi:TPA: DNA cytosine methyltransferase [Clostridioides difficile]